MHHLRRPFASGAIAVALGVELRCDCSDRQATALDWLAPEVSHSLENCLFGREVSVGLYAFHAFAASPFPRPRRPEFQDYDPLLELADGTEHLAN